MTMLRFVMYWALAGVLIPVTVIIIGQFEELLSTTFSWLEFAVFLWPSWILMGATYEREFSAFGLLVLAISIGLNVALYSAVGTVFWFLFNRFLK